MSDNQKTTIESGLSLEGFRLERKLGAGGMGEVWLAHQEAMDRKVALKVLSQSLAGDPEFNSRFIKEVQVSAKLHHPNIVTAYHAGTDQGVRFLVTSFVDGMELKERLDRKGVIPEAEALKLTRQIASALDHAWEEHKIIHRDVKPANVMVDKKGNAMLMDMGISKSMTEDHGLTMTGTIMGTPHYMSPEQAKSDRDLDFRVDVYALGATLYHMVTGRVPYEATTALGVLSMHLSDPFPPPQEKNPSVSEECAALMEIMMAKSPEERQPSWSAVIADIDSVAAGEFPMTPRPGSGRSVVMRPEDSAAQKGRGSVQVLAGLLAAVVVISLIALAIVAMMSGKHEGNPVSPDGTPVAAAGTVPIIPAPANPKPAVVVKKEPKRPKPFSLAGKSWKAAVRFEGHNGNVNSATFSPDGKRVVTGGFDHKAMVWDAASGRQLLTLEGHTFNVSEARFSPDGDRIVTAGGDMVARVWDAETGIELLVLKGHKAYVYSVAFSPDGTKIVSSSADKTARVWDASTGQSLVVLRGHTAKILSVCFSSDGRRVLTGCGDRSAKIWDTQTGKEVWTIRPGGPVTSSAFDSSGKRVAIGCWDKTGALFNNTGKMVFAITKHKAPVSSVAFSPDDRYLLTSSRDKTAMLWDTQTGMDVGVIKGHTNAVLSAVFSPDGKRILTGSWDGTAIIWEAKE